MGAQLIDGKALAGSRESVLHQRCESLRERGVIPSLVVLLVGENSASEIYVRFKTRAAARIGIKSELRRLSGDQGGEAIGEEIERLNRDPSVHGILLQLPLPSSISPEESDRLTRMIAPEKDVDGLHPENLGLIGTGEGFTACTPLGCLRLLEHAETPLTGARALVIGRSRIVGRPMAALLTAANATVTIAHSKSRALDELIREAEIVIAAAGVPSLVKGDWLHPSATVIDVGIHRDSSGRLSGDVDFPVAFTRARAITPVPGGVGPMTVSSLMDNLCTAAERQGA